MSCLTLSVSFLFSFHVHGKSLYSAKRELGQDYRIYTDKILAPGSAQGSARLYGQSALPKATAWTSLEVLKERFEHIRDERFLVWKGNTQVLRRSSWLYPDDGCFARASLAIRNVFRWFHPLPNKIFVFGNLRVKTKNSPRGVVGWWYHVAPVVEVNEVKYVLDPAIEFTRPLPMAEWLARMGRPERMKVAICSSGTYSPGDRCIRETNGLEIQAERAQQHYLTLEWNRMRSMGRTSEL